MNGLTSALVKVGAWESGSLADPSNPLTSLSDVASAVQFFGSLNSPPSGTKKSTSASPRPPRPTVSTTDLESGGSTAAPCPELTTDSQSDTASSSSSPLLTPASERAPVFEAKERPTIRIPGGAFKKPSPSTSTSLGRRRREEDRAAGPAISARPEKKRKTTSKVSTFISLMSRTRHG